MKKNHYFIFFLFGIMACVGIADVISFLFYDSDIFDFFPSDFAVIFFGLGIMTLLMIWTFVEAYLYKDLAMTWTRTDTKPRIASSAIIRGCVSAPFGIFSILATKTRLVINDEGFVLKTNNKKIVIPHDHVVKIVFSGDPVYLYYSTFLIQYQDGHDVRVLPFNTIRDWKVSKALSSYGYSAGWAPKDSSMLNLLNW